MNSIKKKKRINYQSKHNLYSASNALAWWWIDLIWNRLPKPMRENISFFFFDWQFTPFFLYWNRVNRDTRHMFSMTYWEPTDIQFSVHHHAIHISTPFKTSGVMSSSGSDNRMSHASWMTCGNCASSDLQRSATWNREWFVITFRIQNRTFAQNGWWNQKQKS